MFPVETIEKILSFCDGKTLMKARLVNEQWKQCVEYLTKRTKIWKYCCLEEIPTNELIEYLERYKGNRSDDKFLEIYRNWYMWHDIDNNIDFQITLCPAEIPRITCIAVSGRFIAVGSEDGKIRIYNDHWDLIYSDRYQSAKIAELSFLQDDGVFNRRSEIPFLIVYYKCYTLYLVDYEGRNTAPLVVENVILYNAFKIYLCVVQRGGRVSVVKLEKGDDGEKKFYEITYVRIYSPDEVTGVRIWNGTCIFLMNSEVKVLKYDSNVAPITMVESKTNLKYQSKFNQWRSCFIYRNDIIVSISKDKLSDQLIELFILETNGTVGKKIFNTFEVLKSNITCMFLYGNTFILGVDVGCIYFYNIYSWKTFDIRNYSQCVIVGKHPIINIDVKESSGERKFYVASSFNIHEVTGFIISVI